ncbi:ATP synthase d subunit [Thoreauomyces humboldtii]|nr:ATP synthase d subunit [Thoreauomyces humboldtii]
MATPARQAATRVDWSALGSKLKPETVASVNAFRRRHTELTKTVTDLREQSATIDFQHYAKILKNQKVVQDAERAFKGFSPATYDLKEQLRAIESQQKAAVTAAQKTAQKVNIEVDELKSLLTNIETARPVDQLTVEDVAKAYPDLDKTVEKMVKRGQWKVPGYYERFGDFIVGF